MNVDLDNIDKRFEELCEEIDNPDMYKVRVTKQQMLKLENPLKGDNYEEAIERLNEEDSDFFVFVDKDGVCDATGYSDNEIDYLNIITKIDNTTRTCTFEVVDEPTGYKKPKDFSNLYIVYKTILQTSSYNTKDKYYNMKFKTYKAMSENIKTIKSYISEKDDDYELIGFVVNLNKMCMTHEYYTEMDENEDFFTLKYDVTKE